MQSRKASLFLSARRHSPSVSSNCILTRVLCSNTQCEAKKSAARPFLPSNYANERRPNTNTLIRFCVWNNWLQSRLDTIFEKQGDTVQPLLHLVVDIIWSFARGGAHEEKFVFIKKETTQFFSGRVCVAVRSALFSLVKDSHRAHKNIQ